MSRIDEVKTIELDEDALMSEREALRWLRQVDGAIYHNRHQGYDEDTWVAVVQTPAAPGSIGKVIMAFGETVEEAACAAEAQWHQVWGELSTIH
jgi:hypothetical protein